MRGDAIWLITRLFMSVYETLLKDPKKQSARERENFTENLI